MSCAALMLAAWSIEAVFGWPNWLYRRVRHPVVWFGVLTGWLDRTANQNRWPEGVRYLLGALSSLLAIAVATGLGWLVASALPQTWGGFLLEALIASSLLASRSLYEHVACVARPLGSGDTDAARRAVSMIVGRDPAQLEEAGIARAAIESLAENASDGVIAPLFWGAIFGLPGLAAYKAINTLDSMIGHRTSRHEAFGGFAARLDDVANLVPARLTGGLFALASARLSAVRVMLRDARKHRSPNAGWPEAALAGALEVRLSGPRNYAARQSDEPWLNASAGDPEPDAIRKALDVYLRALAIAAILLVAMILLQVWL